MVEEKYDVLIVKAAELLREYEILFEADADAVSDMPPGTFVVHKNAVITSVYITNASLDYDLNYGMHYIHIELNAVGTKLFAQITAANIGRRLAIMWDNQIMSAPIVRERINDGKLMLSGNFTPQEAADLAQALRVRVTANACCTGGKTL